MRTNVPMTTDAALADANGWALVNWNPCYEAACDSVMGEYAGRIGFDPDYTDAHNDATDAVNNAVTNSWSEGMSHDEWVSVALRRLCY